MMHDRFDALVDLLLAGGLDAAERREAESHAAACSPCGALLADARSFRAWATGAIAPDAPPRDLEDRLIARFRAAHGAKPRRRWPGLALALKLAGGLAAAVLLIVVGAAFTAPADYDGYISGIRAHVMTQSGIQDAESRFSRGKPRGITALDSSESADFRANDRDRNRVEWATKPSFALEDAGVDVPNGENRAIDGKRGLTGVTVAQHGDLVSLGNAARDYDQRLGDLSFVKRFQVSGGAELDKVVDKVSDGVSLEVTAVGSEKPAAEPPKPPVPEMAKPPPPSARKEADLTDEARKIEDLLVRNPPAKPEPVPFQAGRKLIRNADMTLEVVAYDAALTRINAIVTEEKGFVSAADTERMANGKISATVTLRIPPERFEAVVERFRALGTVRHQSITTQDVTKAYVDLESRLSSKQSLMDRLKKVLAEAKGTVKELMEVEVQMGKTLEDLEAIKGELKYYDNLVGLSTIILRLAEKDLGQPFEVVQTLQAAIGITSAETEAAYVRAQKIVADAGGQVIDSNLVRSKDGSARGTIKAKVDAEKFPALREELRKLGHVDVDTVVDRKTARGGQEGPARPDAPVRKEQAVITLSIVTPPIHVARRAQLSVEARDVEGAYLAARKSVEAAGGKVLGGSLTGRTDGMTASLTVQVETGAFVAIVDGLKAAGKVLQSTSSQAVPPAEGALVREKGEIELALSSPPALIGEEQGLARTIRDTFSGSVAGLLWSVEKLFVGISLAGPWLALALGAWFLWRRVRRKKAAQTAA